jgi:hypothetical protein
MIHTLLVIALAIFVIWLVLFAVVHVVGWGIHLLWILILAALVWWLVKAVAGRSRGGAV